jgi:hypothetical protein
VFDIGNTPTGKKYLKKNTLNYNGVICIDNNTTPRVKKKKKKYHEQKK